MCFPFQFRHSLVWFCLCLVAVSQCLKLEKFMKNDETEVDPEVKSSLLRRQPRFLFRVGSCAKRL